jgi:ferredoxin-nitrite reductase
LADIGLLGKNVRVKNEVLDAVDVFVGGRSGSHAKPGTKILEDVPCADLPHVLAQIIPVLPYFSKRAAHSTAGDAHATPTPAAQLHAPA